MTAVALNHGKGAADEAMMRLDRFRRNTANLRLIVAISATISQNVVKALSRALLRDVAGGERLTAVDTYKYRSTSSPPFHDTFFFDT